MSSLTEKTRSAKAIDRRSWRRRARRTSGLRTFGKRVAKNSGIASWRSRMTFTPTSLSGSAAKTRKSGRLWTWTTP